MERGHRTPVITRKGGKVVTVPLAPRTARAIDLAIGERCEGPVFLAPDGRLLDRHSAGRIVRRVAHRAGIVKPVGPHTLRHASPRRSTLASHSATCRKPCLTPIPVRLCATTEPERHWIGTPPMSSPPTSPELPDSNHKADRKLRLAGPEGSQAERWGNQPASAPDPQ